MVVESILVPKVAKALNLLTQCRQAAKEGKLGLVRADLPDHYVATDKVRFSDVTYVS